jgi:hypothetical protein
MGVMSIENREIRVRMGAANDPEEPDRPGRTAGGYVKRRPKMRADCTWNRLSVEQLSRLEAWLFEERVSYGEAQRRVERELGIRCSIPCLHRHYRRLERSRLENGLLELQLAGGNGGDLEAKPEGLAARGLKLIGRRMLEIASVRGEVPELTALGRFVMEGEDREMKRERLALAVERAGFLAIKLQLRHREPLKGGQKTA